MYRDERDDKNDSLSDGKSGKKVNHRRRSRRHRGIFVRNSSSWMFHQCYLVNYLPMSFLTRSNRLRAQIIHSAKILALASETHILCI
jgi:hypothetical protein